VAVDTAAAKAAPVYGGGTATHPDPGQYVLPEPVRATYLIWMATWQDALATTYHGPALQLLSIHAFCGANPSGCPGSLAGKATMDWVTLAAATAMGGMVGEAGMIGRGEGINLSDDLATREEPEAQAELSQLACDQSFTPTTRVLLANGKTLPIAALKPGDKILATNTKTGKTTAEPITAVLTHHDTNLYNLTVKTAHGTAIIDTTTNHLPWAPAARQWVQAATLGHGTHLQAPTDAKVTVLHGYTPRQHSGWMWDLTVHTDHDFYVEAAATAVLVHNCSMSEAERLASRVSEINGVLDPIAQGQRTTAVMSTEEGVDVLAGGARDLDPAQRALADEDDLLARLPGEHAEITAMDAAAKAGG
jgi:hypothetical protein